MAETTKIVSSSIYSKVSEINAEIKDSLMGDSQTTVV